MVRHANQITLRGLDPRVRRELQAVARRQGVSLNRAALQLLAKGAGVGPRRDEGRIGDALDAFIGTWTQKEADDVLQAVEVCEQIDPELWE